LVNRSVGARTPVQGGRGLRVPDPVEVTHSAAAHIAQRHRIDIGTGFEPLPDVGIFNSVFLLGDAHVLRVPRRHPAHIDALLREVRVVPAVRQAGVRTPRLVAFDTECDLLPVPYAIYDRVRGLDLASLNLDPLTAASIWRDLGRDLARTHTLGIDDVHGTLPSAVAIPDPRQLVNLRASDGWFTGEEATWLLTWLERLSLLIGPQSQYCLLHGDSQATNVIANPNQLTYEAVIDWGAAAWGDSAMDFAGVPLRAVPLMLEGHREIASLIDDEHAEARIVWRHLQLALFMLPRGAVSGRSWAEQPLAMLLEILRFFLSNPTAVWAKLGPRS
jgi:aminoglycoside phosphotransferase (APT) family kinase protein